MYVYTYSLNTMLRVSFSPGSDRACRHCWIASFWTPWENGRYFRKTDPLYNFIVRRRTTTSDDGRTTNNDEGRRTTDLLYFYYFHKTHFFTNE